MRVRAELTMLAQDLFVAQGYDETTVDDIAAAAGMSRRTLFRYFASKKDLVLGKYEILGDRLAEALAARPHDEPIWLSLRRAFDIVVEYFADDPDATRTVAMERIIQGNPALTARQLERVARTQDQLLDVVRARTGRHDPTDPWAAAIVSARALLPHRREEHLGALSDGLAPLVQAAIAWAARDETREPRIRMRALQENLLCMRLRLGLERAHDQAWPDLRVSDRSSIARREGVQRC